MPRNVTLHELAKRLERLEQHLLAPMLVLPHPRAIPGCWCLPEIEVDGRRLDWSERVYHVIYPGREKRPLMPGEYQKLREIFGDKLVEPFPVRVGDAVRRPLGSRDDEDEDEGDGD